MDVQSTMLPLGTKMPNFSLFGIDEKKYTNNDYLGKKGILVMFICNHCPFVKHVNEELVNLTNELMEKNIGVIGCVQMGNGIAHVAAVNNFSVKMIDVDQEQLKKAFALIERNLGRQVQKGALSEAEKVTAIKHISAGENAVSYTHLTLPTKA